MAPEHDRRTGARVRVAATLAGAAAAWQQLEATGHRSSGFQRHAWLDAWQRHVGTRLGVRPAVVVISDPADDRPWMLWPLGLRRHRGATLLGWLGGDVSGYHGFLMADDCPARLVGHDFAALWAQVLAALPAVDWVHLERQPPRIGPHPNPFLQLGPSISSFASPVVRLGADWPAEYRRRASRKTRETDRRKVRKLGAAGAVAVTQAQDPATADAIITTLVAEKTAWLAERGLGALFADGGQEAMLRELVRSQPEAVHVSAVVVGGVHAATHWGWVADGSLYYWFASYRPGPLARFSPGDLMVRSLMEWCCGHGVGTFDFGIGDHGYKLRWADEQVPLHEVVVATSRRGHALVALQTAERWVRRQVKQDPRIHRLATGLRARLRGGGPPAPPG